MRKVLLNLSLLVVSLGIFTTIQAKDIADVSLTIGDETSDVSVVVDLKAAEGTEVKCVIEDDQGEVIYKDVITVQNQLRRKFDLKNLPKGNYTIRLEDGRRVEKVALELDDNAPKVKELKKTVSFKPTMIVEDQNLDVHLLAMGKRIKIEFIDAYGKVVYTKRYMNEDVISERFNLEELRSGDYTIHIYNSVSHFYEEVSL